MMIFQDRMPQQSFGIKHYVINYEQTLDDSSVVVSIRDGHN